MRPSVHLRPDRLRAHAAAAADLAVALESASAARPRGGTARGPAELDTALRRAARELIELGAVLAAAAAAAESADHESAAAVHRAGRS